MTLRIGLTDILVATVLAYPGWAQDEADGSKCDATSQAREAEPPTRMHATKVKDVEGKLHYVWSPVKEMKVARLIFIGQPALPLNLQEQITKALSTQDRNDDEEALDDLQERIRDAWQQSGYFMAKVDVSGVQVLSEDADSKTVAITVNVMAGKEYRLDEIDFKISILNPAYRSSSSLARAEEQRQFSAGELRAFFPIQQGDIFDTHKIQKGLEDLRQAYATKGYINMSIVPTTQSDETTNRIRLNLEIDEGRQYRIEKVEIAGYDSPAVRTLLRTYGIVPGSVFDGSQLEAAAKQVQATLSVRFDVERRLYEDRDRVALTFRIHPCPAP